MGITVAVKVDHLPIATALATAPSSEKTRTLLVPNLNNNGTVRDTLSAYISRNLFIPEVCQLLSAPLFTRLSEKDNVEDIYKRYSCQADQEISELYLDEDTFTMYGREGSRYIDLVGEKRVDEYHILDRSTLQLKRLPRPLLDDGGRVFVESKDGIIPLLGVSPLTPVSAIKHLLEALTGIPVSQQLLSSVGRVMHDEFLVRDFDGLHKIYEDSIIDLCKSEDKNSDQAHRRMVVHVNVVNEEEFSITVQGRDSVLSVLRAVESRIGISPHLQKISYSGKLLQEKKTLGSYLIQPESVLTVTMIKSPLVAKKPSPIPEEAEGNAKEGLGNKPDASKLKFMRTIKGHVKGTLTIPVIATDTVSDLKRKLKRTLAPLVERNAPAAPAVVPAVNQQPFGDTMLRTPGKSPMRTPPRSRFSTNDGHQGEREWKTAEVRKISSESKSGGGRSLSFSKLMNLSPNPKPMFQSPQHCPVEAPHSPGGPKSGPLPSKKPLGDITESKVAPASAKRLTFTSRTEVPPNSIMAPDPVKGSSCRDLMPELLSLPDLDPKDSPIKVIVERKPLSQNDENKNTNTNTNSTINSNIGSRFVSVQSKIDTKLGAIKNIDKKAVKNWFNTNMESFKEHMKAIADG